MSRETSVFGSNTRRRDFQAPRNKHRFRAQKFARVLFSSQKYYAGTKKKKKKKTPGPYLRITSAVLDLLEPSNASGLLLTGPNSQRPILTNAPVYHTWRRMCTTKGTVLELSVETDILFRQISDGILRWIIATDHHIVRVLYSCFEPFLFTSPSIYSFTPLVSNASHVLMSRTCEYIQKKVCPRQYQA